MASRYCGNCGSELSQDVRFCPSCGRPVHQTAQVSTPEADVNVPQPAGVQRTGGAAPGTPQGEQRRGRPVLKGCLSIVVILFLLVVIGALLGSGGGGETASGGGGDGGNNGQEAQQASNGQEGSNVEDAGPQLSPTETLEVQWQFLNAGQYEDSYNLFAEQSQQLISLDDYSTSYAPTYEISDYTFFSEDIQGETAVVEAQLFLTGTQKGTQQYPITQELVLEDGEWRVVMRDAQAQALLEKQDSSTEQAEQGTQSEDSGESGSSNVIIRVTGNGAFSGNYGTLDSSRSVDGVAPEEYPVEVDTGFLSMDSVSAVMQKDGAGSGELRVQIVVDGEVVKETSTTAEYGVAQVNWSPSE